MADDFDLGVVKSTMALDFESQLKDRVQGLTKQLSVAKARQVRAEQAVAVLVGATEEAKNLLRIYEASRTDSEG